MADTGSTPPQKPDCDDQVQPFNVVVCVWLTAAAALLVAMGEINRLSGEVLDDKGRAWPFNQLMGPGRLFDRNPEGWISGTGTYGELTGWLHVYLLLDMAFIVLYTVGLARWFWVRYPLASKLVIVLGVVDLIEDALAWFAGRPKAATLEANFWQAALPWASFAKCMVIAVLLLALVVRFFTPPDPPVDKQESSEATLANTDWREGGRTLGRALMTQRFSLIAVLPLALLGLQPGADIGDQLPDVQRRWIDGGVGVAHALWAALGLVVMAFVVFILGRLRADFAEDKICKWDESATNKAKHRPKPLLWIWIVGPAAIVIVVVLLPTLTSTDGLDKGRLAIFAAVPLIIGVASVLLKHFVKSPEAQDEPSGWLQEHLRRPSREILFVQHRRPIQVVGDIAAGSALAIGGLGLIRSFTAPVMLDPSDARAWALLLIGGGEALLVWPVWRLVTTPTGKGWWYQLVTPGESLMGSGTADVVRTILLVLNVILLLLLGSMPVWFAQNVGVAASVILALTFLTGAMASMVVLLQYGGAPYLFWLPLIRLRAAPVVSIFLITVIWASAAGGDEAVHGVRGLTPATGTALPAGQRPTTTQKRDTVAGALAKWIGAQDTCAGTVTSDNGINYRLRPLVMVAAEGGGIRAAYWTAAGMQLLGGYRVDATSRWTSPPPGSPEACGARSLFLGAGASGGSVGLTVTRFATQDPSGVSPREQVAAMAEPDALGVGVLGFVIRDLVYSATGLPLPNWGGNDAVEPNTGTHPWVDRAGLMENAWEDAAPALREKFLPPSPPAGTHRTWNLVFGSTSMTTGCRELVSQLLLTPPRPSTASSGSGGSDTAATAPPTATEQVDTPANGTCTELDRPAAQSADLLADYSTANVKGTGCLGDLNASTAAMLSARFAYITPSGVIGPCGRWPTQQLVDGGYTENTGIGTIVDLAAQWQPAIRAYNTKQLTTMTKGMPVDIVVPLVVYLDNGTGSDVTAPSRDLTSELLVPIVGKSRAGFAQADAPALLQRAADLGMPEELWDGNIPGAADLAGAVKAWRPFPVVVVNQSTEPAVNAPLGWVLSNASMATMDSALRVQATTHCDPTKTSNPLCRDGIGALGDALNVLKVK